VNEENKIEIRPGQFIVKGDKKRKVLAVNGGMVTLYNSETNIEFESKMSNLLSSGYVLMDENDIQKKAEDVSSVAASGVESSTTTVSVDNNPGNANQDAPDPVMPDPVMPDPVMPDSDMPGPDMPGPDMPGPDMSLEQDVPEGNTPVETAPASTNTVADRRRVRTPDEIMEDLKRRQEEDRAKIDLRYKEKIFKASQRLKSLPQKRIDALAMLNSLRQSIRDNTGNSFMTDDEADCFIQKAVEAKLVSATNLDLRRENPFDQHSDQLNQYN
jgi:hypothetical protein